MYAIFKDGGHQYRVEQGDKVLVDLRAAEEGSEVQFSEVLMVDGKVGTPTIEGAVVKAKVLGEVQGEKLHVQKFRRRKNYRRKIGHRQRYMQVEILEVAQ